MAKKSTLKKTAKAEVKKNIKKTIVKQRIAAKKLSKSKPAKTVAKKVAIKKVTPKLKSVAKKIIPEKSYLKLKKTIKKIKPTKVQSKKEFEKKQTKIPKIKISKKPVKTNNKEIKVLPKKKLQKPKNVIEKALAKKVQLKKKVEKKHTKTSKLKISKKPVKTNKLLKTFPKKKLQKPKTVIKKASVKNLRPKGKVIKNLIIASKQKVSKKPTKKNKVIRVLAKLTKKDNLKQKTSITKKAISQKSIQTEKVLKTPIINEVPKVKETFIKPVEKKSIVIPDDTAIKKPKIISMKDIQKFEANYNRADMFYKNVLKAEIIKRYSFHNEDEKEFIAKDQNLKIKINDIETTISEKARDLDWNDIYVEIYKKYPYEDGWIKYTQAEYLAYFFPGRVFWAKMEPIKLLCVDILAKAVDSGIYKELLFMYPKNSGRFSKTFKINTKTYSFNFIQTYHEDGENSYYSIGISLPFVLLMDFRIDYKIYKQ